MKNEQAVPRTVQERLLAIAGALTAALAAAKAIEESISIAVGGLSGHSPVGLVLALLGAIAGAWMLRDGLARRSRVLLPDRFVLKTDNSRHLVGRDEDVRRIAQLCTSHRQVNIVGETGAGKSAIVCAGLLPYLRDAKELSLLPMLVNTWGDDWVSGPRAALSAALVRAANGTAIAPSIHRLVNDEKWAEAVDELRKSSNCKPLLVFDQFDDYQVRHREHFFAGKSLRKRTGEVCQSNPFWHMVSELVERAAVHVLFVSTNHAADGLECVRFVEPQVYRIDRLGVNFVDPLLANLSAGTASEQVILYPENGWNRLKEQFIRDLTVGDLVLPAQLKVALHGLTWLPALTLSHYDRVGRIAGLEASLVQRYVVSAASHVQLAEGEVLRLLLRLVDRSNKKRAFASSAQLAQTLKRPEEQPRVEPCLSYLRQKELVVDTLDPSTGECSWSLDHDYLCRGVLEAERRADRWQRTLTEKAEQFNSSASGLFIRWNALLPATTILTVGYQRLRGRVRFGQHRTYLGLSLVRLLPAVFIALLPFGLADAGANFPYARQVRRVLDSMAVSAFRRIPSDASITDRANALRTAMSSELLNRRDTNGWVRNSPDAPRTSAPDPWSQAQSLASLLRTNGLPPEQLFRGLESLFDPAQLVVSGGKAYGWLQGPEGGFTIAQPAAWALIALAEAQRDPDFADGAQQQKLRGWLQVASRALETYRGASAAYNMFPNQADASQGCIYTSALVLLALLEAKESGATLKGDATDLGAQIQGLSSWLMLQFRDGSDPVGWLATPGDPVQEGLALQIYATLLRAEAEAGVAIDERILRRIPEQLERLSSRSATFPSGLAHYFSVFTDHTGLTGLRKKELGFLWHPWGLECARLWRRRLESHGGSRADLAEVRRLIAHLVLEEGGIAVERACSHYTWELSEMLFAMAPLARSRESRAPTTGASSARSTATSAMRVSP
jgi:hypothetical protein